VRKGDVPLDGPCLAAFEFDPALIARSADWERFIGRSVRSAAISLMLIASLRIYGSLRGDL
jgi:hypothetical protein